MGSEQSAQSPSEGRTVSVDNPNEIDITAPVLCTTYGDKQPQPQTKKTKKDYNAKETSQLTAALDDDYVAWIKDIEKQNEKVTRQVRDELIHKAAEVYDRFSYVEKLPVCRDAQKSVLQCYEQNKQTSLNCSEQVRHFTECVLKHQMEYNRNDYMPKPTTTAKSQK